MARFNVADVMTIGAVSAPQDMSYRELVDLMESRSVGAVPVVDRHDRVLGVVSATDLVHKMEFAGGVDPPRVFESRQHRRDRRKAAGLCAGEVMSAPAVTVSTHTSVVAAARLMESTGVKRLPVVDDLGRLVGMVTRRDMLKVFLRPDGEIRRQIVAEVLAPVDGEPVHTVDVEVCDGVVSLTGEMEQSAVERLALHVESLDGVVSVANRINRREVTTR
jgi:CBS domain-containing protein